MIRPHAIIGKRNLLSGGEEIALVKIQTLIQERRPGASNLQRVKDINQKAGYRE